MANPIGRNKRKLKLQGAQGLMCTICKKRSFKERKRNKYGQLACPDCIK